MWAPGIAYRAAIGQWTRGHLSDFDVLEVTVDHCIDGGRAVRSEIYDLVGRIPLTAHGIGLSIGTDVPLDEGYLDQVAAIVEVLKANGAMDYTIVVVASAADAAPLQYLAPFIALMATSRSKR